MTSAQDHALAFARQPTAALVLADGTVFWGHGCGAIGEAVAEVCFNTAMSGYQEILTDPSYAGQIIAFTAPHIGNTGTNREDEEDSCPPAAHGARGAVIRADITRPSNWRSTASLDAWLKSKNIVGLTGIDTRALTVRIREHGMPHGVIVHAPDGQIDVAALAAKAAAWSGLEGLDLAKDVTCKTPYDFDGTQWVWPAGTGVADTQEALKVVVLDFGVKENILRCLGSTGAKIHVMPAQTSAEDVLALKPNGVLLSNGPGDPAATGTYAVETIQKIIAAKVPVFGICLGHQMLGLALGAKTVKMAQGHHGANHPVQDLSTGKVEIVSMNHGFAVDRDSLPDGVVETHVSLFDGSNCGIALADQPVFSVQYHPEASPGPKDSFYLFERFREAMRTHKQAQ
ncbi:MAG TPA: carbamoyl phosphate synthase small subunit [Hyphomonadaceae bacterium]|uniref:glutamine-hydrolyzing carbamoyl-phosphate synthase small subunit n=1 Tax=Aquidulcibacter sp. TaxID=2052990 RepID=UPI00078CCE5A|nr:glutamine-hydrolyzing carbamoyl-phosphate synthase small subunit [Aquidulcibacter sp.]AMS30460.1 carbamoyl-phosphate synthase [Hyphomonadaceae bacterium UKL13-1]MCA3695931.1 glutamine-hydrolyzing carbamoyl-phosphate synthase small subunit [Aquidulcibacter sp.]HCP64303.1 carbamoyl phosphate synthase small subunit [Hyphomonadaceae bacterium]